MPSPELSARLRYLNESAHLLVATAPATSRHLMLRCNALMLENDIPLPEPQSREACSACGTILILGWEGALKTESQRPQRRKGARNAKPTKHTRAIVYECKICNRMTRQTLEAPESRYNSASAKSCQPMDKGTSVIPSVSGLQTPSKNPSSRKRKKTKNSGLEAVLAKKKASEASAGLDLMDFMKKIMVPRSDHTDIESVNNIIRRSDLAFRSPTLLFDMECPPGQNAKARESPPSYELTALQPLPFLMINGRPENQAELSHLPIAIPPNAVSARGISTSEGLQTWNAGRTKSLFKISRGTIICKGLIILAVVCGVVTGFYFLLSLTIPTSNNQSD